MQLSARLPDPADGLPLAPPPVITLALEGGPRSDRWDRLRYVLGHPLHLLALCALSLGGVLAGGAWMLLPIAAMEIAFGVLVPRAQWVERRVDARRRARRRTMAARARSRLVAFMEPLHCRELGELERRAQSARAYAASAGDAVEVLLDDWYGIDRLLGTYVRLSIAHRTARESASLTDRDQLCMAIRELEMQRSRATSTRVRTLIDRELNILRTRANCLEHNEEEREALEREIASIADLLRLIHERTIALVSSADLHGEVERIVADAELQSEAISEMDAVDRPAREPISITQVRVATDSLEEVVLASAEREALSRTGTG
jgi:hypothetical protein